MQFGFSNKTFGWSRKGGFLRPPIGYQAWFNSGVELNTINIVNDKANTIDDSIYIGNNCKQFDGVADGYIATGVGYTPNPAFKAILYTPSNLDGNDIAFERRNDVTGTFSEYFLNINVNGNIVYFVRDNAGSTWQNITSVSALSADTWYEIEGSYDCENDLLNLRHRVLGDNDWIVTPSKSTPSAMEVLDVASQLRIGQSVLTDWAGAFSYLKIYDYCTNDVICEYTFSEGASEKLYDISEKGNHADIESTTSLFNMPTTADGITPWNIKNGFAQYTRTEFDDTSAAAYVLSDTSTPVIAGDGFEIKFKLNPDFEPDTDTAYIGIIDSTNSIADFYFSWNFADLENWVFRFADGSIYELDVLADSGLNDWGVLKAVLLDDNIVSISADGIDRGTLNANELYTQGDPAVYNLLGSIDNGSTIYTSAPIEIAYFKIFRAGSTIIYKPFTSNGDFSYNGTELVLKQGVNNVYSKYIPLQATSEYNLNEDSIHTASILHNACESLIDMPSGVNAPSAEPLDYYELRNLVESTSGDDYWNWSRNSKFEIIDGLYYNPPLTGTYSERLLKYLQHKENK